MVNLITMSLEIKGTIGTQYGRKIIRGFIGAKILAELYEKGKLKIDDYSVTTPEGYQRKHPITRARKFARFIANNDDGISHTNLLIYFREYFGPVEKDSLVQERIKYTFHHKLRNQRTDLTQMDGDGIYGYI